MSAKRVPPTVISVVQAHGDREQEISDDETDQHAWAFRGEREWISGNQTAKV